MLQNGGQESSRRLLKSKSNFKCVLGGFGGDFGGGRRLKARTLWPCGETAFSMQKC